MEKVFVSVSTPEDEQEWIRWKVLNIALDCGANCACRMKFTKEWLQFKLDMPGLSKEDIKISLDGPTQNIVYVQGVSEYIPGKGLYVTDADSCRQFTDVGYARNYAAVFNFAVCDPEFIIQKYETEMDNGLLRLRIPRRKDYDSSWWTEYWCSKLNIYDNIAEGRCSKIKIYDGEVQILPYSTGNYDFLSSCSFPFKASNTDERLKEMMDIFKFKVSQSDKSSNCDHFVHVGDCFQFEDVDNLVMWFDLPGHELTQIEITVRADNTMRIQGEGVESPEDDDAKIRLYGCLFNFPSEYKLKDYKKGMKNGVLKVEIPKVKNGGQDCV